MEWEQGDVYLCSNPDCGLEVFVRRPSRHPSVERKPAVCVCGTPLRKRVPDV